MAKQNRRISNAELAFLEYNVAAAVSIINDTKTLAYWIDDPDLLEMLLSIMKSANVIRKQTIDWMHQRKEDAVT